MQSILAMGAYHFCAALLYICTNSLVPECSKTRLERGETLKICTAQKVWFASEV
ncbi:hypothetical protein KC19_1G038900 [Ceratodon purpureus]|uniref:Uncharacterized protein n=1 Tax=Ceratodon purpureus TaxID=3225 RepID=A0A8T0J253_CERPU|nr:hypothetical protein KC19_1G038900 [Ceratodon purpureus]